MCKWCCVVVCVGVRFHLMGYFVGMGHDFQVQSSGCLTVGLSVVGLEMLFVFCLLLFISVV